MKIRFGKRPEDHHFIQLTGPFIEHFFKVLGWLVVIATLRFAYLKTGAAALRYVEWFCDLLVLVYVASFVDWVLRFNGQEQIAADPAVSRRTWRWFAVGLVTLAIAGVVNVAIEQIIGAFVEFQRATR